MIYKTGNHLNEFEFKTQKCQKKIQYIFDYLKETIEFLKEENNDLAKELIQVKIQRAQENNLIEQLRLQLSKQRYLNRRKNQNIQNLLESNRKTCKNYNLLQKLKEDEGKRMKIRYWAMQEGIQAAWKSDITAMEHAISHERESRQSIERKLMKAHYSIIMTKSFHSLLEKRQKALQEMNQTIKRKCNNVICIYKIRLKYADKQLDNLTMERAKEKKIVSFKSQNILTIISNLKSNNLNQKIIHNDLLTKAKDQIKYNQRNFFYKMTRILNIRFFQMHKRQLIHRQTFYSLFRNISNSILSSKERIFLDQARNLHERERIIQILESIKILTRQHLLLPSTAMELINLIEEKELNR